MAKVQVESKAIVLNAFVTMLEANLITKNAVSWNKRPNVMNDLNGLSYIEQVTPRYNTYRVEGRTKDLSAGLDDSIFGSEIFSITGTFNVNMGWGDFEHIQHIRDAKQNAALRAGAIAMASKIDAYILQTACLASADWTGSGAANSAPIALWSDAVAGYTRLMENGVADKDIAYILSPYDQQALGNQVINLPSTDALASAAYRKGFTGELSGVKTLFTNQLPALKTGTRANGAVAGNDQNVDYKDVSLARSRNGYRMTQKLNVSNVGANATISKGEVFTINGVESYDNRKGSAVSPSRLQQFVVVDAAVADAGGNATLTIYPAMIVPNTGGAEAATNTANATVLQAPVANAVITFLASAAATLSPRMILQKDAIEVTSADLSLGPDGPSKSKYLQPLKDIPLSVRMWLSSDFNTGEHRVRFDAALDANIRNRSGIVRINGGA